MVVTVTWTVPFPFASRVSVEGETEHMGPVGDTWQEMVNVMPASAAPPLKVTGTVTDWPGTIGGGGGGGVMIGGVGVATVIATEGGLTTGDNPMVVSVIVALIEYVGLLGLEYAWLTDRVAAPLAFAVALSGDVVPSPQLRVPLRELPGGTAQFRFAVTVAPVAVVVGVADKLQACPTETLTGWLVTLAATLTVVSVAVALTGKVGLLKLE
jgi:hypothetical protein